MESENPGLDAGGATEVSPAPTTGADVVYTLHVINKHKLLTATADIPEDNHPTHQGALVVPQRSGGHTQPSALRVAGV